MRDHKPIGSELRQGPNRQDAVSHAAQASRDKRHERMRRDRKQGRPMAQQDRERSFALTPGAFVRFDHQPPPFALQFRHRPAGGMSNDRFRRKPNTIALPPALMHQSLSSGTPFSKPPTASNTERQTNMDAVTVKFWSLT